VITNTDKNKGKMEGNDPVVEKSDDYGLNVLDIETIWQAG